MKTFEVKQTKRDNSAYKIHWAHKEWWKRMRSFLKNEINSTEKDWYITSIRRIN